MELRLQILQDCVVVVIKVDYNEILHCGKGGDGEQMA